MKLATLISDVKKTLQEKMNIHHSLTVMNIPKQTILDKGDLILLLDNKNQVKISEWLKDGFYHTELKSELNETFINNLMKNENLRLFEIENFEPEFDMDYVINYNALSPEEKREIKKFIKSAEANIKTRFTKFSKKFSKQDWIKSIKMKNGIFTEWCKDQGKDKADRDCIKKALAESTETNDHTLKKRALLAKCFIKCADRRKNG